MPDTHRLCSQCGTVLTADSDSTQEIGVCAHCQQMATTLAMAPADKGRSQRPPDIEMTSVPGFELLEILGMGSMGVTYKARELKFNRHVALKIILRQKRRAWKR